ncbi:MAG TPA: hypothetical protein VJH20_05385 [Candidatus Nanoarchaeia archaeon]|nr:hypothetical protein [Candidatus Nanoarchaeia archaeon]
MTNIGKAYGFFDCGASKEEIERVVAYHRSDFERYQVPSTLELSLQDTRALRGDPDLMAEVGMAEKAGLNYVLQGTYGDATNLQAGLQLSALFNHLDRSSLFERGHELRAEVVYKDRGEYQRLE